MKVDRILSKMNKSRPKVKTRYQLKGSSYTYITRRMPLLRLKFPRMNMCNVVLCHGWGQREEDEDGKEGGWMKVESQWYIRPSTFSCHTHNNVEEIQDASTNPQGDDTDEAR